MTKDQQRIIEVMTTAHCDEWRKYWVEPDSQPRSVLMDGLGKAWKVAPVKPKKYFYELDWIEHLANLAIEPHVVAQHICDSARGDVVRQEARIIYENFLCHGWMIQEFRFDDDQYPGIDSRGYGPISFCPYCGEKLPDVTV